MSFWLFILFSCLSHACSNCHSVLCQVPTPQSWAHCNDPTPALCVWFRPVVIAPDLGYNFQVEQKLVPRISLLHLAAFNTRPNNPNSFCKGLLEVAEPMGLRVQRQEEEVGRGSYHKHAETEREREPKKETKMVGVHREMPFLSVVRRTVGSVAQCVVSGSFRWALSVCVCVRKETWWAWVSE